MMMMIMVMINDAEVILILVIDEGEYCAAALGHCVYP